MMASKFRIIPNEWVERKWKEESKVTPPPVIINDYKMKSFVLYQQGITGKTNSTEIKKFEPSGVCF